MIRLLYLVLSIYIIVKFYYPLVEDIKNTKKQLSIIEEKIEKNKLFIKKTKIINKDYKKTLQIDKINKTYFFSPNKNSSLIFTDIQSFIKKSLLKNSIEIKYIRWLDVIEKKFYKKYPIKISISTTPKKFANFIKDICKSKKILKIENIKINAINPKKKITYEFTIIGYQLKGNK